MRAVINQFEPMGDMIMWGCKFFATKLHNHYCRASNASSGATELALVTPVLVLLVDENVLLMIFHFCLYKNVGYLGV